MSAEIIQIKNPRNLNPSPMAAPAQDLEVKDAQIIFNTVWQQLEDKVGREQLIFPIEIHWLNGAPGAGKGTHTRTLMHYRSLSGGPIVISDLLQSPEARKRMDVGMLAGDKEVTSLLFEALLKPAYQSGVVVDGYPRTKVQVACVKMLYEKLEELRREFHGTLRAKHFPRPQFHLIVLFIDEKESITRQLLRGKKAKKHNAEVEASGVGKTLELRKTDLNTAAARRRYRSFRDGSYEALRSLKEGFPYHYINAQGSVEAVRERVIEEVQYQSSLELEPSTFDTLSALPLASQIGLHARQELVKRLESYQEEHPKLLRSVAELVRSDFIPAIERHAISGYAIINSENDIFKDPLATAIFLDVLFERGYAATLDIREERVPESVNLKTGAITNRTQAMAQVHIHFEASSLRDH